MFAVGLLVSYVLSAHSTAQLVRFETCKNFAITVQLFITTSKVKSRNTVVG